MHSIIPFLLPAVALLAATSDALIIPNFPEIAPPGHASVLDIIGAAGDKVTASRDVTKRWTDSGLIYNGQQAGNTAVCYGKTSDETHANCGGKGASFDYVVMVGVGYAKGKGCQSIQDRLNAKLSKSNKGGITNYLCDELFLDGNTILHFNACKGQGGDITAELHGIYPTVPKFGCPVWHDKMP